MITELQLLRNVGPFDSVCGENILLAPLTLIYAENGRGKTMLAAILRSLATGDSIPIRERRRLAAQHPPHVIINCSGQPPRVIFRDNVWDHTLPDMAVFDDAFVDQNVYSGLAVEPEHRQNLHDLILGAQGVTLNRRLQELVTSIETHNSALRNKAAAVPAAERGTLSVDDFCALQSRPDIDVAIQAAQRNLTAAHEQAAIRDAELFDTLSLPSFHLATIDQILQQDLPSLDATAVDQVQTHFAALGEGGETWVADGMQRVSNPAAATATVSCPFCVQDLADSPVINHYRAYFSDAYADLKRTVTETLAGIIRTHGGEAPAALERAARIAGERRQFWSRFCDVPQVALDTAAIVRDWQTAREAVSSALAAKQAAPLEPMPLARATQAALTAYETHRQTVSTLNQQLQHANAAVRLVKEQAATADPAALAAELARLRAVKARHTPPTATRCADYLSEKTTKAQTEQLRNDTRAALDQYRMDVFPTYQSAVNAYLEMFNAGFRLANVTSAATRTGSTCNYHIIINNTPVPVAGGPPIPGEPSFRNTLSAGDRNTLALAFFLVSIDQDPALASKVVVIDDPISSLDEHRRLTTVQVIRHLSGRTAQVIVLSHSKSFLSCIWESADRTARAALQVARDGVSSTILTWHVTQDCITEHDRRHDLLRTYLADGTPDNRQVAEAIRPVLEAFLRVAYPEHFPPERLLGVFRNLCEQTLNTPDHILNADDIQELDSIVEYANRFHHITNPAWQSEAINDGELSGFVQRALAFTRRSATIV